MLSASWDAQQALWQLIHDDSTLATQKVPVTIGSPTTLEREHVWIPATIEDWTARLATTGIRNKDETFTLPVHIFVDMTTNTYPDVRNRIKALGQLVEEVISANHTLNNTVMLATITGARLEDTYNDADRRRALLLTLLVRCTAWIGE
jgi:hypothetical protein